LRQSATVQTEHVSPHARLVNRCKECGAWGFEGDLICPECRTPFLNVAPLSERPMALIALLVVLAAVAVLIIRAVHALAS
jgi:hypothetical protein